MEFPYIDRDPSTQFVRDRIAEAGFEDRQYVAMLLLIEQSLEQGGGIASSYARGSLPVEAHAIRDEMRDGHYMSPAEFHRRRAEREALNRAQEDAYRRDSAEAERAWWEKTQEIVRADRHGVVR